MKTFGKFVPVISFFAGIMFTISLGLRSQDSAAFRKADTVKPALPSTISVKPEKQRVIEAQADSLAAISDRLLSKPPVPKKVGEKLVSDIDNVNSEARKVNRSLDRMISSLVPRTGSIEVRTVMPVINLIPLNTCPLPVDSIPVKIPVPHKRNIFQRIFR